MFPFNVRVYGIIINNKKEVLLSDETYNNLSFTKFPGGGLQFGEGTIDALKREFMEEMGTAIEVTEHFYTTDFFQASLFNTQHQVISIYYLTKFKEEKFSPASPAFKWKKLDELTVADVSLPIDKKVVQLINVRLK
jgi:8-oxo-dGTP diphosphatase